MSDLDGLLPSISLEPFPTRSISSGHRVALIVCPKCLAIDDFYNREKTRKFESAYCKGSLPPTVECRNMYGNTHEHEVICAGVNVEHFHTQCACCGHRFMVALPGENNG